MSAKPATPEQHVEIPGICFIRQPEGARRCTLSAGHHGDHQHFYSGEFRNGFRVGTSWPGWRGETQAD
ncbi:MULTISPECIES: hypothetical protein [unclassified Streptomyces]|uniref:DUF397 domain-containing protein n=1 Tax=Streptomyces sp. NBC_00119 TaxID=2975659 RepID=A0AAU1U3R8_9ACTN|nr:MULTISPECIES: hypothetical protein [unclassified Streptomyces]MCX4641467.1 hypothetical protein [Streptomyces sp. NBC_01446]MCX5322113.1 hypothetical protein [Streptomyces sp. NBC_00120]